MNASDLIFFLLGLAAATAVAVGCMLCLVVWVAGGPGPRATEVCPPVGKS